MGGAARGVEGGTIPDFLKHLFNKHDGEARLIEEGDWMPLDEDVCHPAFWSSQFARTEASRHWLFNWRPPWRPVLLDPPTSISAWKISIGFWTSVAAKRC